MTFVRRPVDEGDRLGTNRPARSAGQETLHPRRRQLHTVPLSHFDLRQTRRTCARSDHGSNARLGKTYRRNTVAADRVRQSR